MLTSAGYVNEAVMQTPPTDTQGTESERSLAVVRAWLSRCEGEHSLCRREVIGRLPTRVIDVGNDSNAPYVYVSAGERAPYVALSYCWGPDRNIRLLSAGTEEYYRGIPSEILPRTISDAITITRKSGVRYLWVDALCIMQDSEQDLKHELSYMGDIYANSHFTITARDSKSCTDGCFRTRNWATSAIVPTGIRLPEDIAQGSGLNKRTSCLNRLMALPRHRVPSDHKPSKSERAVLETRGWTLQEEVLSRRVLHCGERELSWICLEGQCSELVPEENTVRFFKSHWQNSIRHALATKEAGHGMNTDRDSDDLFEFWLDLLHDYLKRQISNARDKIVAVSGVQSAIGKILNDIPAAGIWRDKFFGPSLLWKVSEQSSEHSVHAYSCPSWSWASVPRQVTYAKLPTRKKSEWDTGWHSEFEYCVEPVYWNIDDSHPLDGIGGYVEVKCKLLREAEMDCEKHDVKDFLNRPPESRTGAEAIDFKVYNDSENAAATNGAWLLPVRTTKHNPGIKGRGYQYDIETYLLRLVRVPGQGMDFRRIGLVITRSWENLWLRKATEEIIRLF